MNLTILDLASFVGVISFALSGILTAIRRNFDIFGIIVVTILTATFGGVIRDILLNRPPLILTHSTNIYIIFAVIFVSLLFRIHKIPDIDRKLIFVISDAIGLVAFSINGSLTAIEYQLSLFGIVLMGFITPIGGGIIRDIIINDVPFILKDEIYGTISVLIAITLYFFHQYNLINHYSIILLFFLSLSLRIIAYTKKWNLPKL